MRLLALASIPIALVALWAGWRAVAGRPVRRFALNAVFASLLLVYFAITAGLGIDAGIAGGRMYLMAVALGLGVSSIGAFFDDDLAALVKLDPAKHYPALLVALGAKS